MKQLGPKTWIVRVTITDPRTGKRKDVRRRCRGTKRDAERFRAELLAELEDDSPKTRQTLSAYARRWLEVKAGVVAETTAEIYLRDLEGHILPALGDVFVAELRPEDVRRFVAEQQASCASTSVRNRVALLRQLAADALADGHTDRLFTARVTAPPARTYDEDEPNLFTAEQAAKVWTEIPVLWQPLYASLQWCGLRWSEATALRWDAIDREAGVLRVLRVNVKGKAFERTKSKRAKRPIPLPAELDVLLELHRRRLIALQNPGLVAGWVFPTGEGKLHAGYPLLKVVRRAIARAKVDVDVTVHGLRRTFNDLTRKIASETVARAIVGHATQEMTSHYSVVRLDEKREAQTKVIAISTRAAQVSGGPADSTCGTSSGTSPGGSPGSV
jgi:integrase